MGVGDVIMPKPEIKIIPTQLDGFTCPRVYTYSLESTIAEKFDAIITRMELTSHMKDYYGIYYLAAAYPFDGQNLRDALFETLQTRATPYNSTTIVHVSLFANDLGMSTKWKHYVKTTLKIDLSFDELIRVITCFIGPALEAVINDSTLPMTWNPEKTEYRIQEKLL